MQEVCENLFLVVKSEIQFGEHLFPRNSKNRQSAKLRDCAIISRKGGGVEKNEPHIEKCYVAPPANKGKFSSDPPPDLPVFFVLNKLSQLLTK